MSNASRREYIELLRVHYQKSTRYIRSLILSEVTRNLSVHRKHAVRLMNGDYKLRKRSGRKRIYTDVAIAELKRLWLLSRQMCSKKLKIALVDWLPAYECDEAIKRELLSMSHSTMDRFLKSARSQVKRKNQTGTVPNRRMKNIIPVKPLDWNIKEPGHLESDTVAHCGDSMSGLFAWSITFTDVFSGWTENRAMWGKTGGDVVETIRDAEKSLPFSIKSFSCDNGNEFLNHLLLRFLREEKNIILHRGRPYRKNDQCHVEQKNYTHVRELFGYERLDEQGIIEAMNDLYRNEWSLLNNFFIPQFKLIRKIRVGAKYKREYEKPQTPYKRILASAAITDETKQQLNAQFQSLNPFELNKNIELKLKRIYKAFHELKLKKETVA